MGNRHVRVSAVRVVGESKAESFGYYSLEELDIEILRVSLPNTEQGSPEEIVEVLGLVIPGSDRKTYWLRSDHTPTSFPKDLIFHFNEDTSQTFISLNGNLYFYKQTIKHIGDISGCELEDMEEFVTGDQVEKLEILMNMAKGKKGLDNLDLERHQELEIVRMYHQLNCLSRRLERECNTIFQN